MLRLRNLSVSIGRLTVTLERLDIAGKTVLIGRNGSGKTTLLRAIAGFLGVGMGKILLDGEDITGLPPEKRPLGYVPQAVVPIPMQPAKQLEYFARLWGCDYRDIVEQLNLQGLLSKTRLSAGERQLLAIATSLLKQPKILLLDEPTSSLDWFNKQLVWDTLGRLDVPMLYVTHDPVEAIMVAEEVALLANGVVQPSRRYPRPADLRETLETLDLYRLFDRPPASHDVHH